MDIFSQYDLKQILLMRLKVGLFESKKIDLKELIDDLTALYMALEMKLQSFPNKLQSIICDLELVYASLLDNSLSRWKEDPHLFTEKCLHKIKQITLDQLNFYLQNNNKLSQAISCENKELICSNCMHAWQPITKDPLVICPKCETILVHSTK